RNRGRVTCRTGDLRHQPAVLSSSLPARPGAVRLGVRAYVVERAGKDRDRDRRERRAVGPAGAVITPLSGRNGTDDQPDHEDGGQQARQPAVSAVAGSICHEIGVPGEAPDVSPALGDQPAAPNTGKYAASEPSVSRRAYVARGVTVSSTRRAAIQTRHAPSRCIATSTGGTCRKYWV